MNNRKAATLSTLLATAAVSFGIGCKTAPTRNELLERSMNDSMDFVRVTSTEVVPNDKFNLNALRSLAQKYQFIDQNHDTSNNGSVAYTASQTVTALQTKARAIQYALTHSDGNVYLFIHGTKDYGAGSEHRIWPTRTGNSMRDLSQLISPLTGNVTPSPSNVTSIDANDVIDLVAHARSNYPQGELEGRMTSDSEGSRLGLVFPTRGTALVADMITEARNGLYLVDKHGVPTGSRIDLNWHSAMQGSNLQNGIYDDERPAVLSLVITELFGKGTD